MNVALDIGLAFSALLFVPFSVEFTIENGRTQLRWGLFHAPASGSPLSSDSKLKAHKPRKRRRGGVPNTRRLRALLWSPDFLASLGRLGRRLLTQLRPRQLQLCLRLGLGDPADTGRALGALSPLLLALVQIDAAEVRFEPDFLRRVFELRASTVIRVVPGVLLGLVFGYLLTPPPWRALVRYARA